jgi:cell division protein FtsL
MKNRKTASPATQPLIRFRFMVIGLVLLLLVIAGPLLVVTKQVYITDVSMRMNRLSDSLRVLHKEISTLQLTREHLSANERIESFARASIGLEYPTVNQIVIVKMSNEKNEFDAGRLDKVLGVIKRSLGVDN